MNNQHDVTLGPTAADDPNFDDGLYDVFKYDITHRWSDAYVIRAVKNGAQGPIRNWE